MDEWTAGEDDVPERAQCCRGYPRGHSANREGGDGGRGIAEMTGFETE